MHNKERKSIEDLLKEACDEEKKYIYISEELKGLRYKLINQFSRHFITKNRDDLESILNEVTLRCIRSFDSERYTNKFITYFNVCAVNELEILKKREVKRYCIIKTIEIERLTAPGDTLPVTRQYRQDILNIAEKEYDEDRIRLRRIIYKIIAESPAFLRPEEIKLLKERLDGKKYEKLAINRAEVSRLKQRFRRLCAKIRENIPDPNECNFSDLY